MKHLRISHCRFALGNITDDDDDDDDDDEALTRRNKYPFAVVRTLPGVHRLRIPPFSASGLMILSFTFTYSHIVGSLIVLGVRSIVCDGSARYSNSLQSSVDALGVQSNSDGFLTVT